MNFTRCMQHHNTSEETDNVLDASTMGIVPVCSANQNTKRIEEIQTNFGTIPIEDFRDIKAIEWGFESYEEMFSAGYRLGKGLDRAVES